MYNLTKRMKLIKRYKEKSQKSLVHEEPNYAAFQNFTLYCKSILSFSVYHLYILVHVKLNLGKPTS